MKKRLFVAVVTVLVMVSGRIVAEDQPKEKDTVRVVVQKKSMVKPHIILVRYAKASHISAMLQQVADFDAQTESGLLKGRSKAIGDDRTNTLLLLTLPENKPLFEKLLKILDVEVLPGPEPKNANKASQAMGAEAASQPER